MNFVYLMVDYTWVKVHSIMKYTNVLIWVEAVALWEKGNEDNRGKIPKPLYYLPIAVMTLTTVCYVRYSNLCYLTYELKFTQAISYCTELKTRMESTPGYYIDIPVVYLHEKEKIEPISNSIYEFPDVTIVPYGLTIINDYAWKDFMYRWIGFAPQVYYMDDEYTQSLEEMNLPRYPNDGSIQIIDGVMIVNF